MNPGLYFTYFDLLSRLVHVSKAMTGTLKSMAVVP